jgi:hypothetical protein
MASPFTYGSVTNMPNGPGAGTDNLTGLTNGKALGLGNLTNGGTPYANVMIPPIKIKTGTTASGTLSLYLITSEDGTIYTDGISPTSTSDQSGKIVTATLAAKINVSVTAAAYYFPEIDVLATLGFANMPNDVAAVMLNNSGGALDGTAANFSANYLPVTWT